MIALVADHLLETVPIGQHRLDLFGGRNQRRSTGRRISFIGVLHGHANDSARLQIDRMLGFVGEMPAAVLHLSDLVVVRAFLLPFSIEARQVRPRRRLDARGLRQLDQEVVIALARIALHNTAQGGVRFQRRGIDPDRLASHQPGVGEPLQVPREDRVMGFDVDQPARARDRRMSGGTSGSTKPRNSRSANESAARQAIARSASKPSK